MIVLGRRSNLNIMYMCISFLVLCEKREFLSYKMQCSNLTRVSSVFRKTRNSVLHVHVGHLQLVPIFNTTPA